MKTNKNGALLTKQEVKDDKEELARFFVDKLGVYEANEVAEEIKAEIRWRGATLI